LAPLQDPKTYLRLICAHRRHLRFCFTCVHLRLPIRVYQGERLPVWIVAGSKPVTAPPCRAKLGAFARCKNAICVLSLFIGVICVPALSALYLRSALSASICGQAGDGASTSCEAWRFARSKNAICVLSVLIGVICVPALSAYICDRFICVQLRLPIGVHQRGNAKT
jgi:hypothetical protein